MSWESVGEKRREWEDKVYADERQDALDGAALRRLREALPEGAWFDVKSPIGTREWCVVVYHSDDRMYEDWHCGGIVAEAADACREALG